MRHVLTPCVLAIALVFLLSASPRSASADTPTAADSTSAAQYAADKPSSTPAGTTFILPSGFTQRVQGNAVLLMPPEADGSRIALIDAVADDPDAAVAEG